jgi:hypothetical protein
VICCDHSRFISEQKKACQLSALAIIRDQLRTFA